MNKLFLTGLLLAAGIGMAAAQSGTDGRVYYLPAASFVLENRGSSRMTAGPDYESENGNGSILTGTADGQGATYSLTGPDLGINGKKRLSVKISGLNRDCRFDVGKLLKVVVNASIPVLAESPAWRNPNDQEFINARNGECMFDLSRLGNITQLTLVFYNCTLADVELELSAE